ncbi:MAG: LysM peptidoglycan-binding domain-containing protein [Puniceicoccaceae bacterium]
MSFAQLRPLVLMASAVVLGTVSTTGQVTPVNVQLANLRSDVDRLDQVVRSLRFEVEALRRENRELRDWVQAQVGSGSDSVSPEELNAILKSFEQRIQSANQASRQGLVDEVSKEIESLAEKTQKAINALAKSLEGQPQLEQVVVFSDDYPRTGTSYTVQSGDSLSGIARKMGSRVDWIRNANRLASDVIYPGQELFIPLKN